MRGKLLTYGLILLGICWASVGEVRGAELRLYFDSDISNLVVGEKKVVKLMIDSGTAYVSGFDIELAANSRILIDSVSINKTNTSVSQSESVAGNKIKITGYNVGKRTNELPKGVFEVASVEMEGVSKGVGVIEMSTNQIVGNDGSTPLYFQTTFTKPEILVTDNVPIDIQGNGVDGVLKFKMTYGGVVNGSKCARNWPAKVVVGWGEGSTKTFENIQMAPVTSTNTKQEYLGQLLLTGVAQSTNLAIFVKGPRHIQTKYGYNQQSSFYNLPGGTIGVEVDPNTTPIYDFTGYPVLPGDVTGENGVQDGLVDGLDFSYVKSQVVKRTEGNDLLADLNGNCKLESQDLTLLMLTLKEKQEQLY